MALTSPWAPGRAVLGGAHRVRIAGYRRGAGGLRTAGWMRGAAFALVPVAQQQVAELLEFITRQGIISVPDGSTVSVLPTPRFYRWTSASMWTPGPFEARAQRAVASGQGERLERQLISASGGDDDRAA